jgi:2-polyprenyl-6-methoxyphenol hydroxylase-like FAD-dependent oxidoreductase
MGNPFPAGWELLIRSSRSMVNDVVQERLSQYGSYVAEVSANLHSDSDIVYSPIEPMLLPWPWFRGRIVIGGDAAHVFPSHLTQGAAMAVEDAYMLANEVLSDDGSLEVRLLWYSKRRYARCAFVYSFSYQWMMDEQSVRTGRSGSRPIRNGAGRVHTRRRERANSKHAYF